MAALATAPMRAVSAAPSANLPTDVVIAEVQTTTVVAGDNLWDLARRFYGDGMRFRQIYAANAAQIREPRLIYIGQKFVVPK
jgi:nucleoid-associated protein YgaU